MVGELGPEVEVTWPYLAQAVDESLDPQLIEHHARQILARAVVHGRLVAFLGAGVSMAYGRLSWPELVFSVLEAVAKIDLARYAAEPDTVNKINARRTTLSETLGLLRPGNDNRGWEVARESAQRLSGDKPLLIFHLCEEALKLAHDADQRQIASAKHDKTSTLAEGLADKQIPTLAEVLADKLGSPFAHDDSFVKCLQVGEDLPPDEHTKLSNFVAGQAKLLDAHASEIGLSRRYFLRAVRAAAVGHGLEPRALSQHDNGQSSPIALLLHEFRVQRYATTNYDLEIEAALAMGLRTEARLSESGVSESVSPVDARQRSFVLGLDTAAAGLSFAIDGRRRHASVLHLHGHINEASTIIASERHYQRQYLRPSSRRDLIDNTIRSLFGANPVIYVGSGISEEDVLRPLREFMSRAPRRNDTLGVALLPAIKDPAGLALQKIECLVRFGIHVIHYGRDVDAVGLEDPRAKLEPAWLHLVNKIVLGMKARLEVLGGSFQDHKDFSQRLLESPPVTMDAEELNVRHGIDGQALGADSAFSVELELESLKMLVDAWGQHATAIAPTTRDLLVQWLGDIASSVMTAFLCARLKTEAEFRLRWAAGLVRPIRPVGTTNPISSESADSGDRSVYQHMTLDAGPFPGDVPNRFADPEIWTGKLDKRWTRLRASLHDHPDFLKMAGRRLVLLPVPRGAGKGSMFDQLTVADEGPLQKLHETLASGHGATTRWRTAIISLNFLSDVSNVAEAIARVIAPRAPTHPSGSGTYWPDSVSATLEYALDARTHAGMNAPGERVLIVLGNAGVLFDSSGEPKNGQVLRLMHLVTDRRFAKAPIDFVVFCDEARVPSRFRLSQAEVRTVADESASTSGARGHEASQSEHHDPTRPPFVQDAHFGERYERPARLHLRGIPVHRLDSRSLHVYAPPRNLARVVAWPFLKPLFALAGSGYQASPLDAALETLHRALGGNRIALTLLMALGNELAGIASVNKQDAKYEVRQKEASGAVLAFLAEASTAMAVHIHESAPETAIQYVFDRWELMHLRGQCSLKAGEVAALLEADASLGRFAEGLLACEDAAQRLWSLSKEVLWHLAVFSHPVELAVLDQCPGIRQLAEAWLQRAGLFGKGEKDTQDLSRRLIGAVAELCVYRCLALRMGARQLGASMPEAKRLEHVRYTVHRMVQRYFMRMMGGRNIEAIEWDQFTTSLYASQPDEAPALAKDAHAKIKDLITALCRYKVSAFVPDIPEPLKLGRTVQMEFQALRAAYFVARSTYSVGVLSHIAAQADSNGDDKPDFGHMEEYRRLIRWITHRAEKLERVNEAENPDTGPCEGSAASSPGPGFFHRGEIVWLYAECGVMSLTQGKLEDAESLLNLAMQAARRIEADDTGSLHVRLLLHVGLTRIERGRPRGARSILEAIARRREGHQVPPLIAEFYLGIIEHLGGEYHSAGRRYDKALEGFRKLGRTRAAAFVLKTQADWLVAQHSNQVESALARAQESIALAQRGGHEDVRMLAILTLVRIRTKANLFQSSSDSYRLLDEAQRYGASMGMPRLEAAAHEVRATLLMSQGETIQSAREATRSAEIAALYDLKLFKCKALLTLARILVQRGEIEQSRPILMTGLEMAHAAEYFTCVRGFRALEVSSGFLAPATELR